MGPAIRPFFCLVVFFFTVGTPQTSGTEVCEHYTDGSYSYCEIGTCCGSSDGITTLPACCISSVCLADSCVSYGVIAGIAIGGLVALGLTIFLIAYGVGKACSTNAVSPY